MVHGSLVLTCLAFAVTSRICQALSTEDVHSEILSKRFGAPFTGNDTHSKDRNQALYTDKCLKFRKQVTDAQGNTNWDYGVERVASLSMCSEVCGPHIAKDVQNGNVTSVACIAIGDVEWVWKDGEGMLHDL